jgi:hypothetical protein
VTTLLRHSKGGQFVGHVKALPGNPYDDHTLAAVIPEMEQQVGVTLNRIFTAGEGSGTTGVPARCRRPPATQSGRPTQCPAAPADHGVRHPRHRHERKCARAGALTTL